MYVERTLDLATAVDIVDNAIFLAVEQNLDPICAVVLDAGGVPLTMKSQDGCGIMRYEIAFGKAYGALGMGTSGRDLQERLRDRPNFGSALSSLSKGRFVPNPGGVLILNEKSRAVGALGISGDTSERDDRCAIAAIAASGHATCPS